jgi:hypothetical protein
MQSSTEMEMDEKETDKETNALPKRQRVFAPHDEMNEKETDRQAKRQTAFSPRDGDEREGDRQRDKASLH